MSRPVAWVTLLVPEDRAAWCVSATLTTCITRSARSSPTFEEAGDGFGLSHQVVVPNPPL